VVIRAYPPTSGGGYTSIKQTFTARPSRRYTISYMYRCVNYENRPKISMYYKNVLLGSTLCPASATSAFSFTSPGIFFFTTDETGVGEIEFRFYNPDNLPSLYFYADKFEATLV